jgi:hypothetical protein
MPVGTNGGNIWFGTGSTGGNDNNTVSNCNLGPAGANLPTKCVYFSGSASPNNNNNITISGNNIYDYFGAAVTSTGIYISGTTTQVSVTGNRFFQTGARTHTTGAQHSAIWIVNTSGDSYTVNNNIIGYASAGATGTYTLNGIASTTFFPIFINVGSTAATNVQNNTITAISYTRNGTANGAIPGIFSGINVQAGLINIGTTTGNTIGATSGTGAVSISTNTTGNLATGIYGTSAATLTVQNNSVGSLSMTSAAAAISQTFYGIAVEGAGSHTVSGNTVGNTTANNIAIGTSGTTTSSTIIYGIYSTATGTTESLNNNTVQNIISAGNNASSSFFGVRNSGAAGTVSMNGNTITSNTLVGAGTAGSFSYVAIFTAVVVTTALNINNNVISSCSIPASTFAGVGGFIINNSSTTAATAITINGNSFSTFNFSGAAGSTGTFYGIQQRQSVGSQTINNNTFNNLSIKTSGIVYLINCNNNTANTTVTGNSITSGFARTVTSTSNVFGIYDIGGSTPFVTSGTHTVTNNTFTNITAPVNSTGGITVIYFAPGASASSGPVINVTGNTVSATNTGTGTAVGIQVEYSPNLTISSNTVSDFTAQGSIWGIYSQIQGASVKIFRNKVYNLSTSGTAAFSIGIYQGDGTSAITVASDVYNNYIGNMSASASSGNNQVLGLYVGGSASNTYNLYHNTIFLNAASSGANFGTAAVFMETTPVVKMINNILNNTSVAAGTGKTAAYMRNGTTLTTYSAGSDNNLFYAGTPGASNLIFYDGTNSDQTLSTYKTRVASRDANSVSVIPAYISTTGSNPAYLHLSPDANCDIDGKGIPVAAVTVDYDNDPRDATTPDIGADEFTGNFSLVITNPAAACGSVDITAAAVTAGSSSGTTLSYWMDLAATTAIPAGNGTPAAITTSGTYYIKSVKGSCSDVKVVNVTVNARPTGAISGTATICAGSAATLTLSVTGSGTISGLLSDGTAYSGTAPTITVAVSPSSNTSYTISTMNDANCSAQAAGLTGSASITVTPASGNLAAVAGGSQVCANNVVVPVTGSTYSDPASCDLIAKIIPSGASPVSGSVNTCVTIDNSVQTYIAEPYVQRHYDIEPASSPSTATARVTLYFTDNELVNYNSSSTGYKPLPTSVLGNADPAIANLRVNQFHGTGTVPGSYTGAQEVIDPADADIVWNASASRWEVTIDVNGFSGFYITSIANVLPINISYFKGARQNNAHLLSWKVNCYSTPSVTLTLERSTVTNGGFTSIYSIQATAARCNQPFDHTDAQPQPGMNYYRLKMTDADGKVSYSGIVALLNATKGFEIVSIAPNPVVDGSLKLNVTTAQAAKIDVVIIDMQGRVVQRSQDALSAGFNSLPINVAGLSSGTYSLYGVTADGRSSTFRFVKQ